MIHPQIVIALSIQNLSARRHSCAYKYRGACWRFCCAQCGDSLAPVFTTTHLLRT